MLLTITATKAPATDLGYLLHKNPSRVHKFKLGFGRATVFYPEAAEARCTMCLLVEIDPIALVRKGTGPAGDGGQLTQYVNDRPYVASSFLSVALSEIFGTAMTGRCKDRPELAEEALPFEVSLPVLPSSGGEALIRALFEPLGYVVAADRLPLDETFPDWGASRYYAVTLTAQMRLQDLLDHLYVLIPVLDDEKHYWVGDDEVDKLLRRGGTWLPAHPAKDQITRRYLKNLKTLARQALERLAPEDGSEALEGVATRSADREQSLEGPISLNAQRIERVTEAVLATGAKTVVDLGCGEGKLLSALFKERQFEKIVGVDVSLRSLEIAEVRLNLARLDPKTKGRISLLHGSLMYRDERLQGFDVATVIEVIEHLDAARLHAFERVLFEAARPRVAVITTPNVEYNVRFERLPAGQFRHPDHRFEWTRAEFRAWAKAVAERSSYAVEFDGIGEADPNLGTPTQMAVFRTR